MLDLMKEKNKNGFKIYSPSGEISYILEIVDELSFDVIGSNNRPMLSGRFLKYNPDSNVCKTAAFECKVNAGQNGDSL